MKDVLDLDWSQLSRPPTLFLSLTYQDVLDCKDKLFNDVKSLVETQSPMASIDAHRGGGRVSSEIVT